MSSWIVDHAHINLIVAAAYAWDERLQWVEIRDEGRTRRHVRREIRDLDPTEVGQRLYDANVLNVQPPEVVEYLREEGLEDEIFIPEPFLYREPHPDFVPDPVVVLKAIACLEYQCDFEEDEEEGSGTEQAWFLESLKELAITKVAGYEDAPWEITRYEPPWA